MSNFDFNDWQDRIANRSDITGMLTHLTKPSDYTLNGLNEQDVNVINLKAVDNLIKILIDKKITGSTTSKGFIVGKTPAVCFQEVPMYSLVQNVAYENKKRLELKSNKIRYCGAGLAFGKFYIYSKGGRPVIYEETQKAKTILPEEEHWRIVNLKLTSGDPNIVDWMHEREWRYPNDFEFEWNCVSVILYDINMWNYFRQNCPKEIFDSIYSIIMLKSVLM